MPTEPTATPVSVITAAEKDIAWIKGHVLTALLTVALLAGSIIGGVALFESLIERHDARVAAAQQAKEGVDTATTAALMAQLTQDRVANTARDAQQTALIQTLVGQMASQHAQTARQIKTDGTLDAKTAAARLIVQTKMTSSDVTVVNDFVTMTLPLTRIVVSELDMFSQAQADVINLQGQLSAQQILTSDAKVEASDAQKIIAADKVELIQTIKADNAACKAEVDKQASKDRKRGFWATLGGIVTGVILRSVL
jgi:hypothetical protein